MTLPTIPPQILYTFYLWVGLVIFFSICDYYEMIIDVIAKLVSYLTVGLLMPFCLVLVISTKYISSLGEGSMFKRVLLITHGIIPLIYFTSHHHFVDIIPPVAYIFFLTIILSVLLWIIKIIGLFSYVSDYYRFIISIISLPFEAIGDLVVFVVEDMEYANSFQQSMFVVSVIVPIFIFVKLYL